MSDKTIAQKEKDNHNQGISQKIRHGYNHLSGDYNTKMKLILSVLLITVLPVFLTDSAIRTLTWIFTLAIATVGYNVLYGYTGMLSFGHAAFWGAGAYTAALITEFTNIQSLLIILFISIVLSSVLALIIGSVSLRNRDIYYSLLTLALAQILWVLIFTETIIPSGGVNGISIDLKTFLPIGYQASTLEQYVSEFYYFFVGYVFLIVVSLVWTLLSSPMGLLFKSIRDNEVRSSALGLPTNRYKLYSTVISGGIVGLGGSMYAILFQFITPSVANWTMSGELIFMVLLGGTSSFLGPIAGAVGYIAIREYIADLLGISWRFTVGALLIFSVIVLKERGIWGGLKQMLNNFDQYQDRGEKE